MLFRSDLLSRVSDGGTEEEEGKEAHVNTVFGVFACLRLILPCIDSNSSLAREFNEDQILDHYICMYELCLFYASFYTNHNLMNAALETLALLLQNPPKNVVAALLSREGITQRVNKLKERGAQWASKISLSTTVMSEDHLRSSLNLLEADIDIPDIKPKVEKWMTDMPDLPVINRAQSTADVSDSSRIIGSNDLEDYSGLVIGSIGGKL